jgi:hypothetical protein
MKQNSYQIINKILSEEKDPDKPKYVGSAISGAGIGAAGGIGAKLVGKALGGSLKPLATKPGMTNKMARGVQTVGRGLTKTPVGALAAGGAGLALTAAAIKRARQKRQELS